MNKLARIKFFCDQFFAKIVILIWVLSITVGAFAGVTLIFKDGDFYRDMLFKSSLGLVMPIPAMLIYGAMWWFVLRSVDDSKR